MISKLDWPSLVTLHRWTALAEIGGDLNQIGDTLFGIRPNCYVTAVSHDAQFRPSRLRLITSLWWAESNGAALRAALMDIEADEPVGGLEIPTQMLLRRDLRTYSSISAALNTGIDGGFLKHADYRIAIDGAFIHRVLSSSGFEFYFRSAVERSGEAPYAIKRKLPP